MRPRNTFPVACLLAALAASATAAPTTKPAEVPLTADGQRLLTRYTDMLTSLRAEVTAALPAIDPAQRDAFVKAYTEEAKATAAELRIKQSKDGKDKLPPAHEALTLATTQAAAPAKAILDNLQPFLADNKLDATLAKSTVLTEATPRALALFAQQSPDAEALVEQLLADAPLMQQMLIAGGAEGGKYAQAMQIYTAIRKANPKSAEGLFQRLALAISLEHAVPIAQTNPAERTDAPATIDPVKRYQHYEKAWLDGELDPTFKTLTAWEYRNVVNGDEPDETLAWGREMLRNYRPDQVRKTDFRWRYVESVRTEVKYGSQELKNDLPSLQKYQNIIANGGVCGRRAFFGRFILRSFGIPTVARPQPGHASLAHWTPHGWVICLGANWGWGRIDNQPDLDFLAMTQARKIEPTYQQVLRAQWIATTLGEKKAPGFHAAPSGLWNGVALYRQRAIITEAKAIALEAVGTDIGERDDTTTQPAEATAPTDADKKISVDATNTITIPAIAINKSAKAVTTMKSHGAGFQLHCPRGGEANFTYTFNAPHAGKYTLSALVVTVTANQTLQLQPNDAAEPLTLDLPYTVGKWDQSKPLDIELRQGENTLRFTRKTPDRGISLKSFTLTPVK